MYTRRVKSAAPLGWSGVPPAMVKGGRVATPSLSPLPSAALHSVSFLVLHYYTPSLISSPSYAGMLQFPNVCHVDLTSTPFLDRSAYSGATAKPFHTNPGQKKYDPLKYVSRIP